MLKLRSATESDVLLYFNWANDALVRSQSFDSTEIKYSNHEKWFYSKLLENNCIMLVFKNESNIDVGQVRLQIDEQEKTAIIGVSVDMNQRGKGYASQMLLLATDYFFERYPSISIDAFIKQDNIQSKVSFEKAGFVFQNMIQYQGFESYHYIKQCK